MDRCEDPQSASHSAQSISQSACCSCSSHGLVNLVCVSVVSGGGLCGATNHSHHHGLLDSVYWQTRLQAEFYQKMRRLGIFVNAPDVYFQ